MIDIQKGRKMTPEQVRALLSTIIDENIQKDIVSAGYVKKLEVNANGAIIEVVLNYPAQSVCAKLQQQIGEMLAKNGLPQSLVHVHYKIVAQAVQKGVKLLPQVRNIIAVSSGKGGVGKSTTTANLALALAAEGARVGVLDADIYGPSQPMMLGMSGKPESTDGKTINPLQKYGIQASSIGFLIDPDTPMIWRGPMVTQALEQLLYQTNWEDLDYLLIDMPPGTGDVQLTLSQKIPVSGAVVVTTPQDIALLDARKGFKMFEKVEIPTLGIIENMALHVCSSCGHIEHIFGQGGAQKMAEEFHIPFLGALPLDIRIREHADNGEPTVVAEPEGELAQQYKAIARQIAIKLAEQARDYTHKFPNIVVQKT